jgi:hypothetical protein
VNDNVRAWKKGIESGGMDETVGEYVFCSHFGISEAELNATSERTYQAFVRMMSLEGKKRMREEAVGKQQAQRR